MFREPSSLILPLSPRLAVQCSICAATGLHINRLERSRRYLIWTKAPLTEDQGKAFLGKHPHHAYIHTYLYGGPFTTHVTHIFEYAYL